MHRRWTGLCAGLGALLVAAAAPLRAQLVVPAGADFDLGGGSIDLAGTGLRVDGAMAGGNGIVAGAESVWIGNSGVVFGESARFDVLGDWHNDGLFEAGLSRVRLLDTPGADAGFGGATGFHALELYGASGKTYVLPAGQTQHVQSLLRIQGSAANPLQLVSTAAGQAAFLDLAPGGQQVIADVGVSDVHATGQWLAPGQQNQGGGGNALRWFSRGTGPAQPVPLDSVPGLVLMAALMVLLAGLQLPARRRSNLVKRRVS